MTRPGPGMAAHVEVEAGRRSAPGDLFDPAVDSLERAFKES